MATERPDNYEKELEVALNRFHKGLTYFLVKKGIPKHEAQDIATDIFTSLWQQGFNFNDPSRDETLESYLFIRAGWKSIDYYRKMKNSPEKAEREWAERHMDNESTREVDFILERTLLRIHEFIKTQDPLKQKLFKLVYIDGLSVNEAAGVMGIPSRTAANWKEGLIKVLREKFGEKDLLLMLYLLPLMWDLYKN